MEAIGFVASIGGIIQLTIYGIETIEFLKTFLLDCESDVTGEFVNGLVSSAKLLQDVQILCHQIQEHKNPKINQIRTATLQLHLEDCTNDLQSWRSSARKIERADALRTRNVGPSSRWFRTDATLKPIPKVQRFLRAVEKAICLLPSRNIRAAIQERFQKHISNITVALSIFQTDIQFVCIDQVDKVEASVHRLIDIAQKIELKQRNDDSEHQSSDSSNPAQSISEKQRLLELQSLSSISEKLDIVLQVLSSPGSCSSSISSKNDGNAHGSHEKLNQKKSCNSLDQRHNSAFTSDALQVAMTSNEQEQDSEDFIYKDDSNPIHQLIDDFNLLAGRFFDDIVAEYLFAAERWRLSCIQANLMGLIEKHPSASQIQIDSRTGPDRSRLASSLIALRQRAEVECLHTSIEEADRLLGIDDAQLALWRAMAIRRHEDANRDGLQLPSYAARSKIAESLTRINEWLLTVMMTSSYLSRWHRTLTSDRINRMKEPPRSLTDNAPRPLILMKQDEWERLTLKFWLLDEASLNASEYPTTSFTNTQESELTIVSYYHQESTKEDVNLPRDADEFILIKQPQLDRRHLGGLDDIRAIREIDLPPLGVSAGLAGRAQRSLQEYRDE